MDVSGAKISNLLGEGKMFSLTDDVELSILILFEYPIKCSDYIIDGQVAQLVEHVTENHGVGGSIPPLPILDL